MLIYFIVEVHDIDGRFSEFLVNSRGATGRALVILCDFKLAISALAEVCNLYIRPA